MTTGTEQPPPSRPAGRRRRARRGEGDKLRNEILSAAADLLTETGDEEAVSIRAVADAVGVTPPSIYLHFPDKAALLMSVCAAQFARFDAALEEATRGVGDPLDTLRVAAEAYVRFGLDNPEHYRIMFMSRQDPVPDVPAEERAARAIGFQRLVDMVRRAMDEGAMADADAYLVATHLWTSVHGITSLRIARPGFPWPPLDDQLAQMVRVNVRGLARDPPARRRRRPGVTER